MYACYENCFADQFYHDFEQFNGLNNNNNNNKSKEKYDDYEIMVDVVKTVICMLEKKLVISDDMLILCMEYCKYCQKNDNINNKNSDLLNKFINTGSDNKDKINKITKQR